MADQDFDIRIKTTADTSGIQQTEAELEKLKAQAGAAGAPAGAGGVEGAAAAASTMASSVTLAVGAGVALYNTIVGIAEEQARVNEELDHQVDALGKAAEKWRDLARNTTTAKDVSGVLKAVVSETDALSAKLETLRNKEITGWQQFQEAIANSFLAGFAKGGRIYTDALEAEKKKQEELLAFEVGLGNAAIDSANKSKAAWEQLKLKPVGEAIAEVSEKLRELQQEQAEVNRSTAPGLHLYQEMQKRIDELTEQLRTLGAEQKRQTQEATREEEKKTRELERQTKEKEKQAQAEAGRGIDRLRAAGGSVAGARLGALEQARQDEMGARNIAAQERDLQDRIKRGAYAQTELGGPGTGFKAPQPGDRADKGTAEIVAAIKAMADLWR